MSKLSLLDRPIAFHPTLARLFGNINSAIYWQQLYYWSDKGKREDGFVYKTKEEIEEETTLTERQQDKVRKVLEDNGYLETKLVKANGAPTLHYKVNSRLVQKVIMDSYIMSESDSYIMSESITESTQRVTPSEAPASQAYEIVSDSDVKKDRKSTNKEVMLVLSKFEKSLGVDITGWGVDKTQRQSITNLLTRSNWKLDLIESALDYVKENKDQYDYFPQVLSPYDLDKKWNQLKAHKAKNS